MSAPPHQDLRHFIRVYDDALPATWCTRMLAGFDALGAHHARNGRELRAGLEDSAWTELNVTRHGDPLTARLLPQPHRRGAGALQRATSGSAFPCPIRRRSPISS